MATGNSSTGSDVSSTGNNVGSTGNDVSSTGNDAKQLITDEEKIKNAQMYKDAGNECYKAKNYKGAISKYHRAVLQLKAVGQSANLGRLLGVEGPADDTLTPQQHSQLQSLKMDCYNNLAACLLQQESPNYKRIAEYCDNVLEISPSNVKAIYRKGVALYHMKKYEEAEEILKQIYNKDSAVKKYLSLCKQALSQQDKELKETYKSMFASKKQTEHMNSDSKTPTEHMNSDNTKPTEQVNSDNTKPTEQVNSDSTKPTEQVNSDSTKAIKQVNSDSINDSTKSTELVNSDDAGS